MEKHGLYFVDLDNDKIKKINNNLYNDLPIIYKNLSNDVRFKNLIFVDKKTLNELTIYLNELLTDGINKELISTFLNVLKNEWHKKGISDVNFRFLEYYKDLNEYYTLNYFAYTKEFLSKGLNNNWIVRDIWESSIAEFPRKNWFNQILLKTWNDELESKSINDYDQKEIKTIQTEKTKENKISFDQVEDFINWVKNVNGDIEYDKLISFLTTTDNYSYRPRFIELLKRYTYSRKLVEFFMFKEFTSYKVDFKLFKIIADDKKIFLKNVQFSYLLFKSLTISKLDQKDILLDNNITLTPGVYSYLYAKNNLTENNELKTYLNNTSSKILTLKVISKDLKLEFSEIIDAIKNSSLNDKFVVVANKYLVNKNLYESIKTDVIPNVDNLLNKLNNGYYGCSYLSSYLSKLFTEYELNKKSRIIYIVLGGIDLSSKNIEIDIDKGIIKKNCNDSTFSWFESVCDKYEIFDDELKNKYLAEKHFIPDAFLDLFTNDTSVHVFNWTSSIYENIETKHEQVNSTAIFSKLEDIKITPSTSTNNEINIDHELKENQTVDIPNLFIKNDETLVDIKEEMTLLKELNKPVYSEEFVNEIGKLLKNTHLWEDINKDKSFNIIDFINTKVLCFSNETKDFYDIFHKFIKCNFGSSTFIKYSEILQSLNDNWISISENKFKEFMMNFESKKNKITNYKELEKIYIFE